MLYIFSLYFYHTAHSQSLLSSPTRRSSDLQYGLNYGRGVKAIAEELGLTIEDTEGLIQGIFDTYPGLKEWQDKVKRAVVEDRKSTRLNSSHVAISYAVFCLKKKIETRKLVR